MAVNLKTLSQKLGLSQTTVSRGLNGYSDVAEDTRRRIQDMAARLNYSPNTRAKGLATGRSMVIGHVIPATSDHEMVNPLFADFVAAASSVYAANGFDMLMVRNKMSDEAATYRRLKATSAVDGVIIQGPTIDDARIALLKEIGIPFVVHGRSSEVEASYSWVDVNNRRAFERATQMLIQLGHKRIALLNGLETMDFARRRREGFIDGLQAAGLMPSGDMMCSSEMTEHYGYAETSRLLSLDLAPTAILSSSLITALGVRRAIEDRGLKLGVDISVVTHDDALSYLPNGYQEPVFTATRSSISAAGRIAADMLIERIKNPHAVEKSQLLEVELLIGQSSGPAKE